MFICLYFQCKIHNKEGSTLQTTRPLIEPKCMEFISALAAGNRAKLMIEITSKGLTPLTIALAVAAKQTGGRLVCILPSREEMDTIYTQLKGNDLKKVIRFVVGNPCEVIKQYKKIDFIVIDCKFEDHLRLFKNIDVNSKGSVVVVVNNKEGGLSFGEVVKGKRGVESVVTLPIGEGMELTRIGSSCRTENRRFKRFHVVVEN